MFFSGFLFISTHVSLDLIFLDSVEAYIRWGEKLHGHLMACFVRNIHTKNYQNLIIGFKVTVRNVGDGFFDTQCSFWTCKIMLFHKNILLLCLTLPYFRGGQAVIPTCPALMPYQFGPMRLPECNHNGVFTRSSKRPANFQQMYSKYTWQCWTFAGRLLPYAGSCKHPIRLQETAMKPWTAA